MFDREPVVAGGRRCLDRFGRRLAGGVAARHSLALRLRVCRAAFAD